MGTTSYTITGPALTPYSGNVAGGSDANVNTLLSTFYYGGTSRDETLTVNGLTPGSNVTLTVLGAAFGAGAVGGREELVTGSGGATVNYEENNGMFSTLAYHTVVPGSGTISITSHATDGGGDTLHYYGFTVTTPEPSTFVPADWASSACSWPLAAAVRLALLCCCWFRWPRSPQRPRRATSRSDRIASPRSEIPTAVARGRTSTTNPLTLSAGNDKLVNFSFQASQAGDAVPVLATVSGGTAGSARKRTRSSRSAMTRRQPVPVSTAWPRM